MLPRLLLTNQVVSLSVASIVLWRSLIFLILFFVFFFFVCVCMFLFLVGGGGWGVEGLRNFVFWGLRVLGVVGLGGSVGLLDLWSWLCCW